eukprot:4093050-Prymnesium_polylepis.1
MIAASARARSQRDPHTPARRHHVKLPRSSSAREAATHVATQRIDHSTEDASTLSWALRRSNEAFACTTASFHCAGNQDQRPGQGGDAGLDMLRARTTPLPPTYLTNSAGDSSLLSPPHALPISTACA